MRVLFLAHAYPRFAGDPVGSFIANLAVALRDEGVDVVISAPSAPELPLRDTIDGIRVERFRYAPRGMETLAYTGTMGAQVRESVRGKLVMGSYLLSALRAANALARRERVALVHAHWWFPAGLVASFLRGSGHPPFVVTSHGSDLRLARSFPGGARLFARVASRAAAMTAVSSWLAREAEQLLPGLSVRVMPMPVLGALFHPGDERDDNRLLFVGKLSEQKGLARLLSAMTLMRTKPALTVVGAGRLDDTALRDRARALGLDDRIEWLPILSQTELAVQYRRAAVHVIPALDEGLGLTAVESLLSETPVVGFHSGGLPDIVRDGETGRLVPPGDEPALASALDDLMSHPALRRRLGAQGRAHAERTFGLHAVARGYAELYQRALASPTAPGHSVNVRRPGRSATGASCRNAPWMTPQKRPAPANDTAADPSRPALLATLTFAVCTLLLAWPALGGGFLVNPRSDQYIGGWPVRDFAGQALKAGQGIPQWNPYLFGGLPYIAAMHGDIFYPTALLRLILPTDIGLTWGFVIHIFLAGCFTYGFLRAWGLRFYPSLVGGIAYMMSGDLAGLVSPGHDGKLFVSALMPLTLWLLVRGVRDGRHWAWGGIALAVGLAVLSPHPQLLQYMLLTTGAFGLFLTLTARADGTRLTRREGVTRLALALGAVVLGGMIGAVQYLPVAEYIPFSPRAGGMKGWEHAISYSMPIEELINVYLPQFSGILDRYWGRNQIHLHSEYAGAAVLLLASAAFGGEQRKAFRRFWAVTLAIAVLWALGGYTPFYQLVYALVPGTKYFRAPSTMLMVVSMATSVLAALGTERILDGARSRRFFLGWIIGAAVVALLATVGLFTNVAQSIARGWSDGQLDDMIAANQVDLALGAWRSFLFVAIAAGLVVAARQRGLTRTVLGWSLAAVVALDLWSIERLYWLFSPRASVLYASDPATEYLRTAEPGRVLAAPLSNEGIAFRDPFYGGDALMAHRVRLVKGYHGNELGRYQRLASKDAVGDYGNLVNPAFWRLTNARYLYTNVALGDSGMRKLVGPVKNAAGSTVYLYRLPGDNPPAWLAPAMAKAGDDATAGTMLDPRFDPLRVAVIDSTAPIAVPPITKLPEPLAITSRITRYDPGHIAVDLSAPAPAGSALVVSENYFPGWMVTVPGHPPFAAVRTDYTFLGAPLPAGATKVLLDFHDPAYERGKLVTFLAALLALLATAAGAFTERRRRVA